METHPERVIRIENNAQVFFHLTDLQSDVTGSKHRLFSSLISRGCRHPGLRRGEGGSEPVLGSRKLCARQTSCGSDSGKGQSTGCRNSRVKVRSNRIPDWLRYRPIWGLCVVKAMGNDNGRRKIS
ncbi:hypothetical protein CEXT_451941 [Caerostris extrusa]|uniref:Uncharacterized protein n=1 Tax=Caerostris extrusa TaxID=172846 RepID=A0AAV4P797_CAEEX|nr:hypothetical protein CEXT_451941 [Caerostris extrusa]